MDTKVYPTSRYWYDESQNRHPNVLLGFGGMTEEEIEQGIKQLSKVWSK
ncbi:DNA-binding transcriptional MocR family regulator [Salibacterium salarium]|nr:hypothetical protein [Salibacterium salarium]MDQ0297893.1 DNA-binding transcriptional MocR family regulator [Salibacterium salarium]